MNEKEIRASFRERMNNWNGVIDPREHNKSVLREMRRNRDREEASWQGSFQERLDAAWQALRERERRDESRGYHVGPGDPDWQG